MRWKGDSLVVTEFGARAKLCKSGEGTPSSGYESDSLCYLAYLIGRR